MRCELVTEFARLEALSTEWQRWVDSEAQPNIFMSWPWVRAFWSAHKETVSLRALVVHDGGRPAGVLPLIQRGKRIEFIGTPESDVNDMLCDDRDAAAVLEAALTELMKTEIDWASGVLHNLPSESRIVRSVPALPRRLRRHLQLTFRNYAPAILLDQDRTERLNSLLRREKLRKSQKRLEKEGRVVYRHCETREQIREHLDSFYNQHITRWALAGVRSEFLEPERRAFVAELVEEMDPCSGLLFGVLEVGGHPAAYHVGLRAGGKLISYRPSFDANYWRCSPGDVMLRCLFEYCRDSAVDDFDFSLGDEPYKFQYANHSRELYSLHLERRPLSIRAQAGWLIRNVLDTVRRDRERKASLKARAVAWEDVVLRGRWKAGGATLTERCLGALRTASRRLAGGRDDVLLYSWRTRSVPSGSAIEIARLNLNLLARLFVDCPESMNRVGVSEYRARLQRGREAYVATDGTGDPYVFWMAEPGTPPGVRDLLPASAVLLDDYWTRRGARSGPIPPSVLGALAEHLDAGEIWFCGSRQVDARKSGLDQAGFEFRHCLRPGLAVNRDPEEAVPPACSGKELTGARH